MIKILRIIKKQIKNDWKERKDVISVSIVVFLATLWIVLIIIPTKFLIFALSGASAGHCLMGLLLLYLAKKWPENIMQEIPEHFQSFGFYYVISGIVIFCIAFAICLF